MENINFLDSVKESQLKKVEVQKVLQQIQKGYWKNQIDDIRYQIDYLCVDVHVYNQYIYICIYK